MASGSLLESDGSKAISIGTATAPVLAGNHIVINAENLTNCTVVGVNVEEPRHCRSADRNGRKEQPGSNFQPDRNALTKLIAKYKEEEGWMYPLPWEQSLKLEPEEFYVELTLDAYSKCGSYSKEVKVKVEDVFDPLLPGGLPVQRVLIQGNAGFGKSSLCQKSAYDWSHGISTFRALPWDSCVPVLIKLRFLEQAYKLEEYILDFITLYYSPQNGDQDVKSLIRSLGRKLLIILDGYDELDDVSHYYVINVLKSWKQCSEDSLLCCASLLVTTRPTSDQEFLLLFEKHYFVSGISDENVELLVNKFRTYTRPLIEQCTSKFDQSLSKLFRYPKTWLLEKCLSRQFEKKVFLREMPPLIIAVICWVMKQPRVEFSSKDIIYNCLDLLSKRCNQREKFGFSEDHVAEVLLRFGLLCFKIGKTVMEEDVLRGELKSDFSFLVLTGVLKCSRDRDGVTLWEPVHKSFLDALVDAALACDVVESMSRSEIKEFLNSGKTPLTTLHVTIASNNTLSGCTEIRYGSRSKTVFLEWNEKYKNVSYLHKFKTPEDLAFTLDIPHFSTESLELFCKDFPKFNPLVKESITIKGFLNLEGDKQYKMSLALKRTVIESLDIFFPDTHKIFCRLSWYGVRFVTVRKQGNVSFREEFLDKILGLPFDYARKHGRSPSTYFTDVFSRFEIDEVAVECLLHFNVGQQSQSLRFDSENCPSSACRWEQIKEVRLFYEGRCSSYMEMFKKATDSFYQSHENDI